MNPASNSLALLTDLYELTMASGYWKCGKAEQSAAFHLFFRNSPFQGGYAITAGLGPALEFLRAFRFTSDDIEYLGTIVGNDGRPLFDPAFLRYLAELELTLDVDAIPEGTVVFPHEPLLRVCGPILQCQLIETAMLNQINYQSLVATKASRVVMAAEGDSVLEFGLRRAQGIDGGLTASRAAFVGGCAATSNVLAGKRFGIPVKGTHAHSWVMSFDSEPEAFEAYADAMPNNCVFLVDTYDTLQGVRHAVQIGQRLREAGHRMVGIRLDSGDLAWLSIEARKILDAAGFDDAVIVASNDLDERLIQSLKLQGSKVTVWGVGTKLVTAYDQPALGGVYKLGAIKDESGDWQPRIKVSEQLIKTSTPGIQQVRRYVDHEGMAIADMIFNESQPMPETCTVVDFLDTTHQTEFDASVPFVDLLQPMLRGGKFVGESRPLDEIRNRAMAQLKQFHRTVLRLDNPHRYRVGLERSLHDLKSQLVRDARRRSKAEATT
ncbi:nicotinate phosphoribosyltransferase [Stieleria mannarensis]|uniref:nicotinate phosphoribosyltransferase n=1 Tax=Stieleria mannarensis TaxID=2755585 RepID=UPI0016017541|nr:nicotinate phosphoribosyltransferase [Rhodopirellula sp. JC639]